MIFSQYFGSALSSFLQRATLTVYRIYLLLEGQRRPGYLSRYSDSLRAGRSGDRIPVGGEIFRTRPDRPWGPPSLIYDGYRVFPGIKAAVALFWPPTTSKAKVEGRVDLYICSSSGPSWPVLGWPLPLPLPVVISFTFLVMVGSLYSDSIWFGQFRVRIRVGAKFFATSRLASGST